MKNMRDEMPETAAFIDKARELFGEASVNQQIRSGMRGMATFYACENGHEVGTKAVDSVDFVRVSQMVLKDVKK